jgi:hypothetical protein
MSELEIGRLLRAGTTGCVVGCRVQQLAAPAFGGMVRIPLDDGVQIYGLIHDIRIDDDGLVRQLVTAAEVSQDVILDNRQNRNVPLEISVIFIGYEKGGLVSHLLPPRPPLSLDAIYICDQAEVARFSGAGRFGYFRHVLRDPELPVGELLTAHLQQAALAHAQSGRKHWLREATQELIVLLRDDYPTLMTVLSTVAEIYPE